MFNKINANVKNFVQNHPTATLVIAAAVITTTVVVRVQTIRAISNGFREMEEVIAEKIAE